MATLHCFLNCFNQWSVAIKNVMNTQSRIRSRLGNGSFRFELFFINQIQKFTYQNLKKLVSYALKYASFM